MSKTTNEHTNQSKDGGAYWYFRMIRTLNNLTTSSATPPRVLGMGTLSGEMIDEIGVRVVMRGVCFLGV